MTYELRPKVNAGHVAIYGKLVAFQMAVIAAFQTNNYTAPLPTSFTEVGNCNHFAEVINACRSMKQVRAVVAEFGCKVN